MHDTLLRNKDIQWSRILYIKIINRHYDWQLTESCPAQAKHIKARNYFVKDKIDDREIDIQYCPTEKMWADILTKPLQGAAFRTMRRHLQNNPVDYNDNVEQKLTHPKLLPMIDSAPDRSQPVSHCRSVLGSDRSKKVSFRVPAVAGVR